MAVKAVFPGEQFIKMIKVFHGIGTAERVIHIHEANIVSPVEHFQFKLGERGEKFRFPDPSFFRQGDRRFNHDTFSAVVLEMMSFETIGSDRFIRKLHKTFSFYFAWIEKMNRNQVQKR